MIQPSIWFIRLRRLSHSLPLTRWKRQRRTLRHQPTTQRWLTKEVHWLDLELGFALVSSLRRMLLTPTLVWRTMEDFPPPLLMSHSRRLQRKRSDHTNSSNTPLWVLTFMPKSKPCWIPLPLRIPIYQDRLQRVKKSLPRPQHRCLVLQSYLRRWPWI